MEKHTSIHYFTYAVDQNSFQVSVYNCSYAVEIGLKIWEKAKIK